MTSRKDLQDSTTNKLQVTSIFLFYFFFMAEARNMVPYL